MSNKSEPFIEEWELYAKNPNHDLIEKCLKLAQMLEYPELDISEFVENCFAKDSSLCSLSCQFDTNFGIYVKRHAS